jgi:hypothetical protein
MSVWVAHEYSYTLLINLLTSYQTHMCAWVLFQWMYVGTLVGLMYWSELILTKYKNMFMHWPAITYIFTSMVYLILLLMAHLNSHIGFMQCLNISLFYLYLILFDEISVMKRMSDTFLISVDRGEWANNMAEDRDLNN